jgi:catechol 2,3-dioxygenase-like lactoylglutathione lyase family enzyme
MSNASSRASGRPPIRGLAHVCYTVSDLERSVRFYTEVLGLTPAFEYYRPTGEKYGQYIHVGGRNFIELFVGNLAERAEGQPYRHLCLEVTDMDEAVAAFGARGVEVTNVKVGNDHSVQGWITDPDGNRIELHCYTPESKQNGWLA